MTLDSIEKKIRHTLREKLPGCTISDRDSGNTAIRILHVGLFSKVQRREVGDPHGPYVSITIDTSKRFGTDDPYVKVDGGYGEGATRRYKIKGGDFNPRLFELITDYHQRKLEAARRERSTLQAARQPARDEETAPALRALSLEGRLRRFVGSLPVPARSEALGPTNLNERPNVKQPTYILNAGTKIKTHAQLEENPSFIVGQIHMQNRAPNALGVINGVVPGHGGDVYVVTHEGGHVAVYDFTEIELVEPDEERQVGDWVRVHPGMAKWPGDRFQIAEIRRTAYGETWYRRGVGVLEWSCMPREVTSCPPPSTLLRRALEARQALADYDRDAQAFARADREREHARLARDAARERRDAACKAFREASSITAILEAAEAEK